MSIMVIKPFGYFIFDNRGMIIGYMSLIKSISISIDPYIQIDSYLHRDLNFLTIYVLFSTPLCQSTLILNRKLFAHFGEIFIAGSTTLFVLLGLSIYDQGKLTSEGF